MSVIFQIFSIALGLQTKCYGKRQLAQNKIWQQFTFFKMTLILKE